MNPVEASPNASPVDAPASPAAGVVINNPAPPAQPAAPAPATPAAQTQPAGPTENSSGGAFFENFNWLEFGFMVMAAAGLMFTISYYRYKLKEDKTAHSDAQRQIDELKMNLQESMKGKYKTI